MTDATYLVFMGTGRQGGAVIDALLAKGAKKVLATSRNPEGSSAKKLVDKGVNQVLAADFNDPSSLVKAITESAATRVWFTTDWYSIRRPTREKEFLLGKAVLDAIFEAGDASKVEHVVYSSVGDANNCPTSVQHFWSKADVEEYMEKKFSSTHLTWSVIRPVAFFENLDDPGNWNPLTKGSVKFLGKLDHKYKFIATEDIGKGSAVLLMDPAKWNGKKVEAVGGNHTGPELAEALSEASGTPCVYKVAVPRFILMLFMRDLYHMMNFMEDEGYTADMEEYKKIVPDVMDAKAWFVKKGQWSNGEKFEGKGKITTE